MLNASVPADPLFVFDTLQQACYKTLQAVLLVHVLLQAEPFAPSFRFLNAPVLIFVIPAPLLIHLIFRFGPGHLR